MRESRTRGVFPIKDEMSGAICVRCRCYVAGTLD